LGDFSVIDVVNIAEGDRKHRARVIGRAIESRLTVLLPVFCNGNGSRP